MKKTSDLRASLSDWKPQKWPLCSDDDEFLYAESDAIINQYSLPHRAVWGMLYSPTRYLWLVRRSDFLPGFWDAPCQNHVLIVSNEPESYTDAYRRVLREALGLATEWMEKAAAECTGVSLPSGQALTVDLGYSKEYNWMFTQERSLRLEREHVHMFLTLFDGDIKPARSSTPALEWITAERVQNEILANNCTNALAHTFARCRTFAGQITLRAADAPE